jgi:biotin transport system substrate-specific component
LSLALYLVAGVAGVGWFADGSSGLGAPIVGYVVRFLPSAALVGYLAARGWDRKPAPSPVMAAGTLVIYSVGVPWLAVALDVSLSKALRLGMWPFLLGDVLKVAVAAGVFPLAWLAMRRFDRE